MNIIYKNINELIPYEKNPRKNDNAVDGVANSIREFGIKVPLVIDKNNIIVTGHTRFKACKKLGINKVPCIVADDLNEEQLKAYRIADNSTGEKSKWDFKLLEDECFDITNYNMKNFNIDIFKEKKHHREKTDNYYNLDITDNISNEDEDNDFWQMPKIKNDGYIPNRLIGFNYAKTSEDKKTRIHFYLDDYQFERIWNRPKDYIDILKKYECILSPDFSLYMDMPIPMKIWNTYRNRLIGNFYQKQGIKVIPTISWAEKETYKFCFKGIEKKGIVSISTIGVKKDKKAMQIWIDGAEEMIKTIEPNTILVYGGKVNFDYGNINVIYYENEVTERLKKTG